MNLSGKNTCLNKKIIHFFFFKTWWNLIKVWRNLCVFVVSAMCSAHPNKINTLIKLKCANYVKRISFEFHIQIVGISVHFFLDIINVWFLVVKSSSVCKLWECKIKNMQQQESTRSWKIVSGVWNEVCKLKTANVACVCAILRYFIRKLWVSKKIEKCNYWYALVIV